MLRVSNRQCTLPSQAKIAANYAKLPGAILPSPVFDVNPVEPHKMIGMAKSP